jgi:hypothetical protein
MTNSTGGRNIQKPIRCNYSVWPYTENNMCVLDPHDKGLHKDARNREFNNAGYIRTKLSAEQQLNLALCGDPDDDDTYIDTTDDDDDN